MLRLKGSRFPSKTICFVIVTLSITAAFASVNVPARDDNEPYAMPTETPSISGTVSYGNSAVQPKFITAATVIAVCSDGSITSTLTDANGQYVLTGMGTAPCTISVAKESGQNGVSSADAARIAQHNAGIFTLTTNNQKIAADVSGDGRISSMDAALIAARPHFPIPVPQVNIWKFFLPNPTFPIGASPTTREYSCACTQTNQDFIGILIGEVSGNWTNTGARPENSINTTALSWLIGPMY